jgi:hypothetical protein
MMTIHLNNFVFSFCMNRVRLHSRLNDDGCAFQRPSSGSHSHQSSNDNDSGVALLLEKAHAAFQPHLLLIERGGDCSENGGNGGNVTSSSDLVASLAKHSQLSANANVQEYLNTLSSEVHHHNGEIVSGKYMYISINAPTGLICLLH